VPGQVKVLANATAAEANEELAGFFENSPAREQRDFTLIARSGISSYPSGSSRSETALSLPRRQRPQRPASRVEKPMRTKNRGPTVGKPVRRDS
jgi:hypothetical protein